MISYVKIAVVNRLNKVFPSSVQGKQIERLLEESPSPLLAQNHLLRLLEGGGVAAIGRIPNESLPALIRLLGSSSYLSEILIRQGESWPELFLGQIGTSHKTVAQHSAELEPAITQAESFDQFCAALRRHKQREYLRIGIRDLLPAVSMEETVRELSALADASLQAAYRYCRAEVEQDFGPLVFPDQNSPNRFVILGMGKLGGGDGGLSLSGAVSTSMASFSSRRSRWARSRRRAIQPCAAGQQARGLVRRQVDS